MLPKANDQRKNKKICQIFSQKRKSESFDENFEEMADVLNSANFAPPAFLTLPSSGYSLNLKNIDQGVKS